MFKTILGLFIRLPIWLFFSLKPFRPRASWGWKKAFNVQLVRHMLGKPLPKGPDHRALAIDIPPNATAVWIKGIDESLIQGDLAKYALQANVTPASRIPGYWSHTSPSKPLLSSSPPINADEKVILFFHGGGYVNMSAAPNDPTQGIVRSTLAFIAAQSPNLKRVLSLEYRLTTLEAYPKNPFPASIIDALAGYSYLIHEVGFKPQNIVLMGDSAGAHLVVNLTRYIIQTPSIGLGVPGGLILHSPWVDFGKSHEGPGTSHETCKDSDYVVSQGDTAAKAVAAPFDFDTVVNSDSWFSPASLSLPKESIKGLFEGFPKTFITAGGGERLLDPIKTFEARLVGSIGREKVVYYQGLDAVHDFVMFPWAEPERTEALEACAHWFAGL
ncbi:alpha/beta-hydrolase [Sistotremastrum suecicum HHB10207 ss-3]|uniref:Alpha/beta-hydrolase n=1 Tax=Sistotremastrum suecicum HHB10207 ss-3 TaxID=1314776 RepID=A0A166FML3_9AGAM|nr:alpha/beta-hydrolase [Sistotremastrum suecicum HHB10207 ss-3]